jgi:hypothetical protein
MDGHMASRVSPTPDGTRLLTSGQDASHSDMGHGDRRSCSCNLAIGSPAGAAFSPDGSQVATASLGPGAWDAATWVPAPLRRRHGESRAPRPSWGSLARRKRRHRNRDMCEPGNRSVNSRPVITAIAGTPDGEAPWSEQSPAPSGCGISHGPTGRALGQPRDAPIPNVAVS